MYVRTPNSTEPSIIECAIKDNVVVYEVLPIVEEGITEMQLKLIETSPEGARRVLVAPKFAIEVTKSNTDDGDAEQTTTFTALEEAVARAKGVYDARFLRMELDSECIFRAWYADGTTYETDVLQRLFRNGNVLLSESWAKGGTGMRVGEDTNNSMYYSNVSKSEALNAKDIMENSEEILEEVRLHGVYTAFKVDFETGNVEYVSPSFKFKVNIETGELDTEGQSYTFDDEIGRVVSDWLKTNNIVLEDLQAISTTHGKDIEALNELTQAHTEEITELQERVTPIEKGGTGATTKEEVLANLGASQVLSGTYSGNGSKTRFINLGVTPKAVLVLKWGTVLNSSSYFRGGLAVTNSPAWSMYDMIRFNLVEIVEDGFKVFCDNDAKMLTNELNHTYNYVAWI
jgi:hypothetical protein